MVRAAAFAALLVLAAGCASASETINRNFGLQVKEGARPVAMQAATFGHLFLESHMIEWEARLGMLEDDLPPFFDALEKAGYRAEYEIVPHPPRPGGAKYEWYGVNLVVVSSSGKERFVIPGEQGMKTTDYVQALAPASAATGIQAEVLRRAHFAVFALVTMTMIVLAAELPALQSGLLTAPMSGRQWFACVGLALLLPIVIEARKWIRRRHEAAPEELEVRRAVAPGRAAS